LAILKEKNLVRVKGNNPKFWLFDERRWWSISVAMLFWWCRFRQIFFLLTLNFN
jgi:hypothetical protein